MKLLKPKVRLDKNMDDLYEATKSLRNQVVLIWLTMVGYIVYLEFFHHVAQFRLDAYSKEWSIPIHHFMEEIP